MAKKRNGENQAESDPSLTGAETGSEPAAQTLPRLSVTLDAEGAIAWERMRPETQNKLKTALKKGNFSTENDHSAAGRVKTESFPPELCEVVYDSLAMLLMGMARRGGYTQEQAGVLAFSPDEKRALVPASIKVLDKYDASLGKYQEEIMLGVLLVTVMSGKLALLKKSAQVIQMVPNQGNQGKPAESTVFSPSQGESGV